MKRLMRTNATKTMAAAALALALCLGLSTAYAQDEILGDWDVELNMAGNMLPGKLVVTKEGDALKGVLTTPTGPMEIDEIKFDGEKISFAQTATILEQEMLVSFEGTLDGDTFSGILTSDLGPMPVTGKRSVATPPIVGNWTFTSVVSAQDTTLTRTLEVNEDLTGVYKSDEDEWPISDLAVDGDAVTFAVTVQFGGQDVPLTFAGTIDGASMTGAFSAQGSEVAQITALRVVDASSVAGTWSVALIGTPLGDFSHSVTINADGTGTYSSPAETPISNLMVDGDALSFHAAVGAEGATYEVDFNGVLAGGKIEGSISVDGTPAGELLMSQGGDAIPESWIGAWALTVEVEALGQTLQHTLNVAESSIAYDAEGEVVEVESYEVNGDTITFNISMGGYDLIFEGTVENGELTGNFAMEGMGAVAEIAGAKN